MQAYADPVEVRVDSVESDRPVVHITTDADDAVPVDVLDAVRLTAHAGPGRSIWIHGTEASLAEAMTHEGYRSERTLWQMRAALPVSVEPLETRAFTDDDAAAFIDVNNRAFSWHPEQSGMTMARLAEQQAEPWFDPDGFRLYEREGRLAGFCWTKVHSTPERLGEIYVIAVDPDFGGQGLGARMTAAGLASLHARGLDTAMLYVESDNTPAVAVYRRLGFAVHREDTLWWPT